MEQKTIWKTFLIIGINILLILSLANCSKTITEYVKTVNYIYKNDSGYNLTIEVYNSDDLLFRTFSIQNQSEVETHTSKVKGPAPFYFTGVANEIGDSIIVKFNNEQCIYYSKKARDKIFDVKQYDNFTTELNELSNYTLYFTFTEEDYSFSDLCN